MARFIFVSPAFMSSWDDHVLSQITESCLHHACHQINIPASHVIIEIGQKNINPHWALNKEIWPQLAAALC